MARDKFHQDVKLALESDGWLITDDPLYMKIGHIPIYIDLGAERIIAAEKGGEQIAVEIKTFGNPSFITALYEAVGKYILYLEALNYVESTRVLYLAIPVKIYTDFFDEPIIKNTFKKYDIKFFVYEPNSKNKLQWIK
jgi:XisH protein